MAKIAIKALAVAALVCLVFDLAASAPSSSDDQQQQSVGGYGPADDNKETAVDPTSPPTGTFKDKLKGFVSSVKEGAADAYDSVSGSVSGAAHKLDEKRKEAVAGTKKLVNGVVDKIKQKYDSFKKNDDDNLDEVPAHVQQQASEAVEDAKSAVKNVM